MLDFGERSFMKEWFLGSEFWNCFEVFFPRFERRGNVKNGGHGLTKRSQNASRIFKDLKFRIFYYLGRKSFTRMRQKKKKLQI
jgi:hypothetical protein